MLLSPGTRLGAYEITVQIGEGGMGEARFLVVLPAQAAQGDAERGSSQFNVVLNWFEELRRRAQ